MKKIIVMTLLALFSVTALADSMNMRGAFFPVSSQKDKEKDKEKNEEAEGEIEGGETGGNGKQNSSTNNASGTNNGNHYAYGQSKVNTPYLYYKSGKN